MVAEETDREVWELLSGLKPEDRAVIQLYYFDGYLVKEIGQILGSAAARRARVTHNPDTNFKRLIGIYRSIVSS